VDAYKRGKQTAEDVLEAGADPVEERQRLKRKKEEEVVEFLRGYDLRIAQHKEDD
jgi:hypothetical protein